LKKEVHPTFVFEAVGFCHVYCQYITCVYCCLLKPFLNLKKNQIKSKSCNWCLVFHSFRDYSKQQEKIIINNNKIQKI
jgi:hypothetical protein